MPALYFERTDAEEQARHREKLARLPREGGLLIEAVAGPQGWQVEIVTQDWDEPGLLDKIFETILQCITIPGGVSIPHVRIFTGHSGQVVNILDVADATGAPLDQTRMDMVLGRLKAIQPGERIVLETIESLPFTSLIPQIAEIPHLDNSRSERYTYLEIRAQRLSNRFTSILLHFLARSEFQVNIQLGEFSADQGPRYGLYVVDKQGQKLLDNHFTRITMVRALEAMNRMILRFNTHYIRRRWRNRAEKNDWTIYQSRPNLQDYLGDLEDVTHMAGIKGMPQGLDALVENKLLDFKDYYFLRKFERFCQRHQPRFVQMMSDGPTPDDTALCRTYFEDRRRSIRILEPLFRQLTQMEPLLPPLSDGERAHALCRPISTEGYAADAHLALYQDHSRWLNDPAMALHPFLLLARSGVSLREDCLTAVEAAMEGWSPDFIAQHQKALGQAFLTLLDESIRQHTTALVLRNLRQVGLLQRLLPGFSHISGLIHTIADHAYTVDEHSFLAIETLTGLQLLGRAFPTRGRTAMRRDYEKVTSMQRLALFVRKYAVEVGMLRWIPELRVNPSVKPFFHLMEEVRNNSLEYMLEVNLLEHSYATCMSAMVEIEKIRSQIDPLLTYLQSLPFNQQRNLVLAALLHDMKKPDPAHGALFAPLVPETLRAMGLHLPTSDEDTIAWLVRHHLDLGPLTQRMGHQGEAALEDYLTQAPDKSLFRLLVLFTYADRVAVAHEPNKISHDALTLAQLLRAAE